MTMDASTGAAGASAAGGTNGGVSTEQSRSGQGGKGTPPPDLKRTVFILMGLGLFALVYFLPDPPPAVDPVGVATINPSARKRLRSSPSTKTARYTIRATADLFTTASLST